MMFEGLEMKDSKNLDYEDEFGEVELVEQNNPWGTDSTPDVDDIKAKSMLQTAYLKYMTMHPQHRLLLQLGAGFVVCILLFTGISSSSSKTSHPPGVSLLPFATYIDQSASQMYPDNFPDLLFVLEQRQVTDLDTLTNTSRNITQYVLLQSMNTYWKQGHTFRKNLLPLNQELMNNAIKTLNRNVPSITELETGKLEDKNAPYANFHLRVHQAGGSLPFLTNFKVYYANIDAECQKNYNVPIFQRAIPETCSTGKEFWTIATTPILQQLKPKFGVVTPRGPRQEQTVVVAVPVVEAMGLPTVDSSMEVVNEMKETVETLKKWTEDLMLGKLVFLPDDVGETEKKYDAYTAVLDLDTTASQYPSLLCQSSVVLKRQDGFQDVLSSTLQPWTHYVPIEVNAKDENGWSKVQRRVEYVLDPKNAQEMDTIVENANEWCHQYKNKDYMTQRYVQSLTSLVEHLDWQDKLWAKQWNEKRDEYLKGHWLRQPGSDSWSLPTSIVEEIKNSGLRADDPRVKELWNGDNANGND